MDVSADVLLWTFGGIDGNLTSNNHYQGNQGYSLHCKHNKQFLIYEKRQLGVNMGFGRSEQRKFHFHCRDNQEREIRTGESVAIGLGGDPEYLYYSHQRVGINLKYHSEPHHQWRIYGESGADGEPIQTGRVYAIVNDRVEPKPDFLIYLQRHLPRVVDIGWTTSPGWTDTLKKVAGHVVVAAGGPVVGGVVDVVRGRNPVRGVASGFLGGHFGLASRAAKVVAELDGRLTSLEADLLKKITNKDVRNLFLDAKHILGIATIDLQTKVRLVDSLENFVRTQKFGFLNPLIALSAAEIQRARDNFWSVAAPIPPAIVAAMPPDLADVAADARWMIATEAAYLSLPAFTIRHRGPDSGITAIDLIFAGAPHASTSMEDHFFWAHELAHVRQYKQLGLMGFIRKYMHDFLTGSLVQLEADADITACGAFRISNPPYIGTCPPP